MGDTRALLTNLNKKQDFVNGMGGGRRSLTVTTATGKRLAISKIRERVGRRDVDYFPARLGYAATVQKIQGQTLEHVTLAGPALLPRCRLCCAVAGPPQR